MREYGCLICGMKHKVLDYEIDGIKMCEECYIRTKIDRNIKNKNNIQTNIFKVLSHDKEYYGVITGYQHRKGYEDKFYIHMNINEADFSIWYNNWFTEKEIAKSCDSWNINVDELLQ